MDVETMSELDILKQRKLDGRFKSLNEALDYIANADAGLKERDTYKSEKQKLNDWARQNGFGSFKEMQEAAVAAKKPANNGNGNLRSKIEGHYKKFYGDNRDERGQPIQPDPKMFDFLSAILEDELGPLRDTSQMEKIMDSLDESFDHRQELSFLLSLPEAERQKIMPILPDIRKTYRNEKLYERPDDADDNYNGFARAQKNYLEALKRAGAVLPGEERKEGPAPVRRIAFTGSPKTGAPEEASGRPGIRKSIDENPELYNPDGSLKDEVWEEALGIPKDEGEEE